MHIFKFKSCYINNLKLVVVKLKNLKTQEILKIILQEKSICMYITCPTTNFIHLQKHVAHH